MESIDAPPVINNFSLDGGSPGTTGVINSVAGGNATIAINGSFFDTTASTVTFEGSGETLNTASITRNSSNLITVTVARSGFDNSNEPYSIKVLNSSGLSATLADALTQMTQPVRRKYDVLLERYAVSSGTSGSGATFTSKAGGS